MNEEQIISRWDNIYRNTENIKSKCSEHVKAVLGNVNIHSNILELGVGLGNNFGFYHDMNFKKIVGIDICEYALDVVSRKYKNKDNFVFRNMNMKNLDFDKNVFDFVIDDGCICNNDVSDFSIIFSEIYRVLKFNGLFHGKFLSNNYSCRDVDVVSSIDMYSLNTMLYNAGFDFVYVARHVVVKKKGFIMFWLVNAYKFRKPL